jgi:hypothetical protein
MSDFPCVLARKAAEQSTAVDLEKIQHPFQGQLYLTVELLGWQIDEARRQVRNHLLEPQAVATIVCIIQYVSFSIVHNRGLKKSDGLTVSGEFNLADMVHEH